MADAARDEARLRTDELRAGQVRGPLHGIPVAIKDLIEVAAVARRSSRLGSRPATRRWWRG
jgi:aspartyl-tRNA(Asn)/glutamyl-tRNA(Gln) amidotransferase subunit A